MALFSKAKKVKLLGNITCILMMDPWDSSLGVLYKCESIIIKRCKRSRKHAHCFSIKWKAENDRVLNYYLPISILLFSTTTTTYTNDNAAAHQIVISKTFVMSPHMTILGHPHKIFVPRNNRKQKIVSISFSFTRISVSASFPGKLKSHKRT